MKRPKLMLPIVADIHSDMKIISENPFRLLGVYSNSPLREVVANSNKIKAYSKIGKSVDFTTDFRIFLPQIIRNEDTVDKAMSKLNQNDDRLLYSLFWFVKISPIDEIAFGHLCAGNKSKAKEIFEKKQSASSLLNLGIISFVENDIPLGLNCLCKLLQNEDFRNELLDQWFDGEYEVSQVHIFELFIDVLMDEFSVSKLLEYCDSIDKESAATIKHIIVDKTIKGIYSQLSIAKNADQNEDSQLDAGKRLVAAVKCGLSVLKSCGVAEGKLNEIADNAAKQILQCGINYYNKSDEAEKGRAVLPLFKYAAEISCSSLIKQRCEENLNALRAVIDSYPPNQVSKEALILSNLLSDLTKENSKFEYIFTFFERAFPVLAEVKDILGCYHPYFLAICTTIESEILSIIIDKVNNCVDNFNKLIAERLRVNKDALLAMAIDGTLISAWKVILCLDELSLRDDAKPRYNSQRKTLLDIINKRGLNIKDIQSTTVLESERETFEKCSNIDSYNAYIGRFPNGKYVNKAREQIEIIKQKAEKKKREEREALINEINNCVSLRNAYNLANRCIDNSTKSLIDEKFFSLCVNKEDYQRYIDRFGNNAIHFNEANLLKDGNKVERFFKKHYVNIIIVVIVILIILGFRYCAKKDYERHLQEKKIEMSKFKELTLSPSVDMCNDFLSRYPNSVYRDSVLSIHFNLIKYSEVYEVYIFAENHPNDSIASLANDRVKQICDSLYHVAEKENTKEAWSTYLYSVFDEEQKELAREKISQIEEKEWKKESKAWEMAQETNTAYGYKKYLDYHPRGAHAKIAEQKYVDLAVDNVFSGEHGSLPSMDRTNYSTGRTSSVTVENNTSYTLTLLYSGVDKRRLVLSPYQTKTITLKNGDYRIAASVDAYSVRSYAGYETLNGGGYSVSYYISTTIY